MLNNLISNIVIESSNPEMVDSNQEELAINPIMHSFRILFSGFSNRETNSFCD